MLRGDDLRPVAARRAAEPSWAASGGLDGSAHGLLPPVEAARCLFSGTSPRAAVLDRLGRQAAESSHGRPGRTLSGTGRSIAQPREALDR